MFFFCCVLAHIDCACFLAWFGLLYILYLLYLSSILFIPICRNTLVQHPPHPHPPHPHPPHPQPITPPPEHPPPVSHHPHPRHHPFTPHDPTLHPLTAPSAFRRRTSGCTGNDGVAHRMTRVTIRIMHGIGGLGLSGGWVGGKIHGGHHVHNRVLYSHPSPI